MNKARKTVKRAFFGDGDGEKKEISIRDNKRKLCGW